MPCLMAVTTSESCIFIFHGLCPMEITKFEIGFISYTFTYVNLGTYSTISVNSLLHPRRICCPKATRRVSNSLKDKKVT